MTTAGMQAGDQANEYFSNGISEEILNVLAGVPELQVAARTSSFSFKSKSLEVPEIAVASKVRMVLEGSVREQANADNATSAEKMHFHTFLLVGFRHWHNLYFQYRNGALDQQMCLSYDRTMSKWLDIDAWRAWLRANASSFSPDLRKLLKERLQP